METILITGAGPNGVTGKRMKDAFSCEFNVLCPSSVDLDLTNREAVDQYFKKNSIDFVIHCAVVYPNETCDAVLPNLNMFFNLAHHRGEFKKMFYLGSGAEYDKTRDLRKAKEFEIGDSVPVDPYGLYKYILNNECRISKNIYNIRLFGTINPEEKYTKNVISNLCIKASKGYPLALRRNCRFSFTDIDDVIEFIKFGLSHDLKWHDYNFVPSNTYLLSEIAEKICRIANQQPNIIFENEGLNHEYTGSNDRLSNEYRDFTPIDISIQKVYNRIQQTSETIDISEIDNRWKSK